jgi:hypothetical protein
MQRFEFLLYHSWLRKNKPIDFAVNRLSGFENNYVILRNFHFFFFLIKYLSYTWRVLNG